MTKNFLNPERFEPLLKFSFMIARGLSSLRCGSSIPQLEKQESLQKVFVVASIHLSSAEKPIEVIAAIHRKATPLYAYD